VNKNKLRSFAISQTLFPQTSLSDAIKKLGFVQADPIRAPSRAQDLILRHRVKNYCEGDLEKKYPKLPIEEDYLYAYGFMPESVSNLIHPKKVRGLTKFDKKVLEVIKGMAEINPKSLEEHFGVATVRNWWGGRSRAVKHSLDILNYWGFVKVARRERGQRVYKVRDLGEQTLTLPERKRELVLAITKVLSPVTEKKLSEALHLIKRGLGDTKPVVDKLVKSGELTKEKIDGISYLWAAEDFKEKEIPKGVKILAPFDPVVWDRNRFAHLWEWEYRIEAYVPAAKRVRGYYAMPLLRNEDVIGWVNIKKTDKKLDVELGFVNGKPKNKIFERDLNEEIEKLNVFLKR
jgi:hypothetical protein